MKYHIPLILILILCGCSPDSANTPKIYDLTKPHDPIFDSIMELNTEEVKHLSQKGINFNVYNVLGETPVTAASALNQYEMVYAMIEYGADPDFPNTYGNTLQYFMENNRIDKDSDNYAWLIKVKNLINQKEQR